MERFKPGGWELGFGRFNQNEGICKSYRETYDLPTQDKAVGGESRTLVACEREEVNSGWKWG